MLPDIFKRERGREFIPFGDEYVEPISLLKKKKKCEELVRAGAGTSLKS